MFLLESGFGQSISLDFSVDRPVFFGFSPVASCFDLEGIDTPLDLEKALLSPLMSPRIADDPLGHIVEFPLTDNADVMVDIATRSSHNAPFVGRPLDGAGVNATRNRAILLQFVHHH